VASTNTSHSIFSFVDESGHALLLHPRSHDMSARSVLAARPTNGWTRALDQLKLYHHYSRFLDVFVQASAGSTGAADKVVARDWALLRAFKRLGDAAAVLDFLRDSGHVAQPIDDEELWTPESIAARHRTLRDVVRLVHRLVGSSQQPLARMKELHALCA